MVSPAAERGHISSQFDIGAMYFVGSGVAQNFRKAAHWFRMAAQQGHAESQFWLGRMYIDGQGIDEDPSNRDTGRGWIETASAQGHPAAGELLKSLK